MWFGQYDVVTYVNTYFLHLFLWERFREISPMTVDFKAIKPWVVDGVEKVKSSCLKC